MISSMVYQFENVGDDLDLVPLAGRRALDSASLKVGLAAWRSLPLARRAAIVELGAAEKIDASEVRRLAAGVEAIAWQAEPEPDSATVPAALRAFGVDAVWWASLRSLDRWSLASMARRGKDDSVRALLVELQGGASAVSP